MAPEAWSKLAIVFAAGALGLIGSLLTGLVIVPFCARRMFISRESKVGVAQGRTDVVPMGGGFILLFGVTLVVTVFTALKQIRTGYAGLFLLITWGHAVLGFLDDYSKTQVRGIGEKAKVVLQASLLLAFSVFFYWYGMRMVPESDLGLLTLPFIGEVGLKVAYIGFVIVFLFGVSNAVNFTDGFNGLAGGVGAIVALAFAVITFVVGVSEIERARILLWPDTPTGARMFALSVMSAGLAGSCIGYLYYNFRRGSIYFGDTGSMALGSALAFLALFARAEVLMLVIGGVYTAEMLSSGLQKLCQKGSEHVVHPVMLRRVEPTLPFIMAPLHHHFEHIWLREMEDEHGQIPPQARDQVRRALTLRAWIASALFAAVGVIGQYGRYGERWGIFNWACVVGLLMIAGLLVYGILTRLVYDCYFIGPDLQRSELLTLYRGVPLRIGALPLFHVYQLTDIPFDSLGYLERRTALFRLQTNRVDARTAFGLLHFGMAERSDGPARLAHLRQAMAYWGQVPRVRFRAAGRQEVLRHMATCHVALGHPARAVESLEELHTATGDALVLDDIRAVIDDALSAAEAGWAHWRGDRREAARQEALHGHEELVNIMYGRRERAVRVLERLRETRPASDAERMAVEDEVSWLDDGLAVADNRCEQLRAAAGTGAARRRAIAEGN
ncbi:MAG: hypothetical protein HZB16_00730 [Armatimonadetes bacterium]|nr:hypothetical protein [Armatimonadota bacterium]